MTTIKATYGDLQNGDRIHIQGYRFLVDGPVRRYPLEPDPRPYDVPAAAEIIRFTGKALSAGLIGTGYDGGTYGGRSDLPISIDRD